MRSATSAPGRQHLRARSWFEAVLEGLPTPVVLVEAGTFELVLANAAAREVAGGALPLADCTDSTGRRIPPDDMPAARALRGESVRAAELEWHSPVGPRSLVVSAQAVSPMHDRSGAIAVCFEEVTGLKEGQRSLRAEVLRGERLADLLDRTRREERGSLALLDTLFATAPVGIAFFDRELRYVRLNEALAEMNGAPVEEHLGRTLQEVAPDLGPEVSQAFERVMRTGEPMVDVELERTTRASGGRRWWLASYYPVDDSEGERIGIGAVVTDITARKRAERRAAFLARAGALLHASLDYEETLGQLARIAVPNKADWCVVDLLDETGALRRLAVAHGDPERESLVYELGERYPARRGEPGPWPAMETGEPVVIPKISDDLLREVAHDDEHLRISRELGLRSAVVAPLVIRGRPIGTISFLTSESGRIFDAADVELFTELGRRAAVAVENARLYRERDHIARTLQDGLLPPGLPDIPDFEIAGRFLAAGAGTDVGGDFYDAFAVEDGSWALAIGDVCGKGAEAAALTALVRYTIRALAPYEPAPAGLLHKLNRAILRESGGKRFCSVAYATLRGGTLLVARAGHPAPALLRADGDVELVDAAGELLGLYPDIEVSEESVELRPGDALALYTDGLTEAGAPDRVLGPDALRDLLAPCAGRPAAEIAATLELAATEVAGGRLRDDLALVVLRRWG